MDLHEKLSDIQHDIWSHWMQYMFTKAPINPDGTWTMPAWAVERWQRQMNTPFANLTEQEKQSDRNVIDEFHIMDVITQEYING
jgi:hypothetical protein